MEQKQNNGRVNVDITLPEYVNLYLNNENYVVTVTFQITKEMYDLMKILYANVKYFECIKVKDRYYCRFFKRYRYTCPINVAVFGCAKKDKDTLMIMMRETKIALLNTEILSIKLFGNV